MTTPTPPAVSEAMREAVARTLCSEWGYVWDGNPYEDDQVVAENDGDLLDRPSKALFRRGAAAILAGPIASEIARLTEAVASAERVCDSYADENQRFFDHAEAETARLRAALEFYADEAAWSGHPWRLTFESPGRDGHGFDVARAALTSQEQADV